MTFLTFLHTLIDIFLLIVAPLMILSYEVLTFSDEIIGKTNEDGVVSPFYSMCESMYLLWIVMAYLFLENRNAVIILVLISILGIFFGKYKAFNIFDNILSIIIVLYVVILNFKYF